MAVYRDQPSVDQAIEVFARAWTANRSRTHPYLADRVGNAWVLHDAPRTGRSPAYRREEWVTRAADEPGGISAGELDELARNHTRGRYAICTIATTAEALESERAAYKLLGYRQSATEPFMVHPLGRIPHVRTPLTISRVKSEAAVERLAEARQLRPRPEVLAPDSPIRQYVALKSATPIGWVESVSVTGVGDDDLTMTWCSDMFVDPDHRRQGIAKALLSRMLADDRRNGAHASVLLSSKAGSQLYPEVGYRQIGTLLMFTPPRR